MCFLLLTTHPTSYILHPTRFLLIAANAYIPRATSYILLLTTARKGREALFALMALDKARVAKERCEAEARSCQRALEAARRKANVLRELRKRGPYACDGGDGCGVCVRAERQSALALAESELAGLTHSLGTSRWEQSVLAFAQRLERHGDAECDAANANGGSVNGGGQPEPLTTSDGKATRMAVGQILRRPPLGEVIDCRTDAEGRLVVVALHAGN